MLEMQEMWVQSLCQEESLEGEMVPYSSILACKVPWTQGPGRLQSMGSQSDTKEHMHIYSELHTCRHFKSVWFHWFFSIVYVCVCARSCLTVTPWTVACQAPLSMEFFRQEYCSRLPFPTPGNLPNPEMESESLASPALTSGFFTTSNTWEALL